MRLVPQAGELDAEALHRYLTFLWCPGEGTPLKQVRKLLPDEAMVVRATDRAALWSEIRAGTLFRTFASHLSDAQIDEAFQLVTREPMVRLLHGPPTKC